MLVLTRKENEKILIGDDIVITMLGINGKQVRLGIDAPLDLFVHREEIYNWIKVHGNKVQYDPK